MTDTITLLADKHKADLFVPECKNGPTWYAAHVRMDAWAMKRSYSKPLTIAYEIKVSRSDFLQDDKWPAYLDYCNQLYFVCPPKLIDPSEVGEAAGLMWTSKNSARLYTKKKAPYREVEIPEDLWRYILMSRVVVSRDNDAEQSLDYWRRWLANKAKKLDFGHRVGRAIRKELDEKIYAVEKEIRIVRAQNKAFDAVKNVLKELDIDPDTSSWNLAGRVRDRIAAVNGLVPEALVKDLTRLKNSIINTLEDYEQARKPE